jgi:DNA-binding MarR family transcriptional regulator/N-acetylglutamate synthase-like GNAT family acetyltransferase
METIRQVRQFSRFYTGLVGLLNQHILNSDYSLSEVRVLYEIAHRGHCTASQLIETVGMDGGYLSRLLKSFEKNGLLSRRQSQTDGRTYFLQLTAKGRRLMKTLDARSDKQIAGVLEPLSSAQQQSVAGAMQTIQQVLSDARPLSLADIVFRYELLPGDVGYLIYLHGELYARETGYNLEFEGYVCKTFYEFLQKYDPDKDRVFLATYEGRIIGAVAILGHSKELAQLRWLLVHPDFRGIGLGRKLVDDALNFCREKRYRQVYLLTTHQQQTAHELYKRAGFVKTEAAQHQMWGHSLYEERYDLRLEY